MNFSVASARKNTGKDQGQPKCSHWPPVNRVNLVPCWSWTGGGTGFMGLGAMRHFKEWMGPPHTKAGARGGDIQNNRTEVLKTIWGNRLTCPNGFQVMKSTGRPLSGQNGGFKPGGGLCPKGVGFIKLPKIPGGDRNRKAGCPGQSQQCHWSMTHIAKSARFPNELEGKSILARRRGQQSLQFSPKLARGPLQITLNSAKFAVDFALQFLHP